MSLILIISIVIRLLAMVWSIVLLRRMRDWRMGFLTVLLGLMVLRQTLTVLTEKESWAIFVAGQTIEFPGLLVSIMAFLSVFFLGRIITKRQQADKELQEQRDANTKLAVIAQERGELQDWIDTFDTFVGKYDANGIGLIFNETPLKAGGVTRDEVVGKYFPDTIWWSHSERERAKIVECFALAKAGVPSRIETTFRSVDGTPVPIIFNCQPVIDAGGEVKYITAEGKIIIEEVRLRHALQEEKENLEKRVKKRTSELVTVNEKLEREISERKRAEQAILESENFFSGTLNDMLTFVAVLEPDGKVIFVNNTPLDVAGITLNDVKGKMFHDAFWWQYSEQARQQIKEDIRICATGESLVHDIEIQDAGGELIWIEYSMHPVYNKNRKIKYLVPEGRVITELKKAEALQLRRNMVLEKLALGASLVEVLSGLVEISEKNNPGMFCSVLLLDKEKKHLLHGASPSLPAFYNEAIHGLKIGPGVGSCGTAAYTGKRVIVEDIMTHPYWVAFREIAIKAGLRACWSEPIVSSTDQILGTFALYYNEPRAPDSSDLEFIKSTSHLAGIAIEKKQIEEALQRSHNELEIKVAERTRELSRANIQLKEVDRLKSEFLATMSHELRTPLNSILGFVGIILQGIAGEINEEQKKQLSMVYNSAKHLLSLINDILDLSRIESGKMEISATGFKIEEVISEVVQTVSPMISQKGLRIVTKIPEGTPEIYNDRKKILQILLNLVNNAMKFTNTGEIIINCTLYNHNLEVAVSDTGIGIKKEKIDHLFEAFRQVDGTAQRRYQGAGLGLYLCRKLVTLLGGKIWVKSQYGKGSRFTFTLPLRPRERRAT